METATIKKEFLYRNDELIERTINRYNAMAEDATHALNEAEKLLPGPLSPERKESLLENGWEALAGFIQEDYGFPNGDIDTILKLQGLDGSIAKGLLMDVPNHHRAIQFVITEEGVELSPSRVKKIEKSNTRYTNNETQVHALQMARELCKTLNDGYEKGVMNHDDRLKVIRCLSKYVELSYGNKDNQEFIPAVRKIGQLGLS